MQSRLMIGIAFAGSFAFATASGAATLTGSFATWVANVPASYHTTANTGLPLYSTVTTIPLSGGSTLLVAGTADTLLQPLSGWGPWSGGYTGDIVDSTTNSETISFSGLSALGMELSPDLPLNGTDPETFTVTLSDGISTILSGDYPPGVTQFVGFYGGSDITSMTITATNAPDFAFGNFVDVNVPEPMSAAVLGVGLMGVAMRRRHGRSAG
jgi:hypothetical protein